MRIKTFYFLILFALLLTISYKVQGQSSGTIWDCCQPPRDIVPDEKTAIAIAHAVLIPIYGADGLRPQEPFSAYITDGIWTVSGYTPQQPPKQKLPPRISPRRIYWRNFAG